MDVKSEMDYCARKHVLYSVPARPGLELVYQGQPACFLISSEWQMALEVAYLS